MEVFGHKMGLLFSVKARYEIAELDENMSIDIRAVKTALIMNRAYEARKKLQYPGYNVEHEFTEEELMLLNPGEFEQLCDEISAATTEGTKTTVEAEQGKKKDRASS